MIYKSHFDQALHNTTPSLQKGSDVFIDVKPMHWNDIGGLQEVKDQIKQVLLYTILFKQIKLYVLLNLAIIGLI